MTAGKLVTLEGIDGAGKSSHVDWIADCLRQAGKTVVATREPGGTRLGEELRKLLLTDAMHPETEALLLFAARKEHISAVILPALLRGEWVVCDRFSDATHAYQGGGKGLDRRRLVALEQWVHGDGLLEAVEPALTLLFDVPCEVARERIALAGRLLDRFEQEDARFHDRVRHAYLERAGRFPDRFRVLDGQRPLPAMREEIARYLREILQEKA